MTESKSPRKEAGCPADAFIVTNCDVLVTPDDLREHVDLVIRADRVVAIEPAGVSGPASGRQIDGTDLLAIPGLVNAHTHSPENCLRGLGEGLPLEPWLLQLMTTSGVYDPADDAACALAGAVEMLVAGVTTVVDHLWMTPASVEAAEAVLRTYRDVGIRAVVAPMMCDYDYTDDLAAVRGTSWDASLGAQATYLPTAELLAQLEQLMRDWHGAEDGRLKVFAGPGGLQWCSEALLTGLADVARRHDAGVHLHLLETRLQDAVCRHRFDASATRTLERLGLLDAATSFAHGVWIHPEDYELIADSGATLVHTPAANQRLGSGRAAVPALLAAGASVALGTDGAASSDNQDMWNAVKLAALIHNQDGAWVSSNEALAMATSGGARSMGWPSLGTLAPGAIADVALLDRRGTGLAGAQEIGPSLALSETGGGVRHVLVGGRLIVEHGRCLTVDEEAVRVALYRQAASRRIGGRPSPRMMRAIVHLRELADTIGDPRLAPRGE